MEKLTYIPQMEFVRVQQAQIDAYARAKLIADMCRWNAIYAIVKAGSGHIGTSLSVIDIVTWLFLSTMKTIASTAQDEGDIYFSSKGHDTPSFYALLTGIGLLPFEKIHAFRRLGGFDGHPDARSPYMICNTGSLGMGISKAHGIAIARQKKGLKGRIFVVTGDGELQEGQNWEAIQSIANQGLTQITVIVDRNKIQSDSFVEDVHSLGDLSAKFQACGWDVTTCNGHDMRAIDTAMRQNAILSKPLVIIADTVKGKGIGFMEKMAEDGFYKFHAGTLTEAQYAQASQEYIPVLQKQSKELGLRPLEFVEVDFEFTQPPKDQQELVRAYGQELVEQGKNNSDFMVLDGDLIRSCGLIPFSKAFPDRFLECGIAEQDMVSIGSGLAMGGITPIIHSLGCFLSTRPNEQIYNAATEQPAPERKKMIYFGSGAGILPAGPGHSHQEVRAIASVGAIPGLVLLEPANEQEMKQAVRWALNVNQESTYLRVSSVKKVHNFEIDGLSELECGKGRWVRKAEERVIIAYGPVMLIEAVKASLLLEQEGLSVGVLNLPWLNRMDEAWARSVFAKCKAIVTVDDHYLEHGQGMFIQSKMQQFGIQVPMMSLGVTEIPACGNAKEILAYHGLDAEAIAQAMRQMYV